MVELFVVSVLRQLSVVPRFLPPFQLSGVAFVFFYFLYRNPSFLFARLVVPGATLPTPAKALSVLGRMLRPPFSSLCRVCVT